jgi:hypothetical protein
MANETYTLIQKTTLTTSAASITFSSIPQTFTDLVVKVSARTTYASPYGEGIYLSFNGLSTNMTRRRLYGLGSGSGGSDSAANSYASYTSAASQTANTFGNSELYIPNYTSSNYKSSSLDGVAENNAAEAAMLLNANLWSSTAAINSITLTPETGSSFVQYSSVSLYGVAKQGVIPTGIPKASGGDIITNDGTYWIHQFLNSGTFTPSQTLSTEYLVIAGGGGGGWGAGGAGGYRTASGFSVTSGTAYTVTIGSGGTAGGTATPSGSYGSGPAATSGGNSVFSTVTSAGGGYGGTHNGSGHIAAASGGSGGGGSYGATGAGAGNTPSTSPAQGFAGGTGFPSGSAYGGGGGGGSAAVGSAGDGSTGGAGGTGTASSITGTSVTRASGGGGGAQSPGSPGTAPAGGGGSGTNGTGTATSGTFGTGGGGGGSDGKGGAGGSGIVIIRYAM